MAPGVGATGFLGIAPETVPGTYVSPTKFLVLKEEGVKFQQDTKWRRPLRGIADVAGALPGNSHCEGSVGVEITADTLVHLLLFARGTMVKTGTTPNFVYTFTPNANAVPAKTASLTVVRNGVAFGYTGCVIGAQGYSIDDMSLVGSFGFVGRDEASTTVPVAAHTTTVPFGAGEYKLEIPTATQVFDADTFELKIEDNAEPQFRISDRLAAEFIKYGERTVEMTVERDFDNRTEFDAYKTLTSKSVTLKAGHTGPARDDISFLVPASIVDTFEVTGLAGQADLIRASVAYQGVYNAGTSKSYEIVIKTSENVTP